MTKESGFVIINHVVKTTQKFIAFEPLAQAAEHLPFKQGVPGSIPGWLTNGISLCNHILVYYKGFSYFYAPKNTLSFCITAIEKAVNFCFNAPELIKNSSFFVYLTFRLL